MKLKQMATPQNNQNQKHLKGFWPLFILIVLAAITAASIYLFAEGNIVQDNIDSITFWSHLGVHKKVKKLPVKVPFNKITPTTPQ